MTTIKKETTKPVATFRFKGVQASLFANTSEQGVPFFKVALSKAYKDGDDWKQTTTFSRDDLPIVETVVRQAWLEILTREAKPRPEPEAE